jgi:hypothetical protein
VIATDEADFRDATSLGVINAASTVFPATELTRELSLVKNWRVIVLNVGFVPFQLGELGLAVRVIEVDPAEYPDGMYAESPGPASTGVVCSWLFPYPNCL